MFDIGVDHRFGAGERCPRYRGQSRHADSTQDRAGPFRSLDRALPDIPRWQRTLLAANLFRPVKRRR